MKTVNGFVHASSWEVQFMILLSQLLWAEKFFFIQILFLSCTHLKSRSFVLTKYIL